MHRTRRILQPIGAAAAIGAAWGLFEAQWVEFRELEVPLDRLPAELDGLTILHLSDFHLGTVSLNGRTLERAVAWAETGGIDLVLLTGDLLSRERAEVRLRSAVARLRARHGVYSVLGNHDVSVARNALGPGLLDDSSVVIDIRGKRVQIAGGHPREDWKRRRLERLADPAADLRILLFHFPDVTQWLPPASYDLILSGHLHGGQICLPTPRGKLRLEHLRAHHWEGLHRTTAGTLHVSRGLGTSFVPFRFLARPDATKLTLKCPARQGHPGF
jgi:predicted MPP superfamily phosphohydrolase